VLGCSISKGTVNSSLLVLSQIIHHLVIFLDLLRITNFRLFDTIIDEGRQLQFLHLKFLLNRYLIRNRIFLFGLQFCRFILILHSETPALYDFNFKFMLILEFFHILTIDVNFWCNVFCSNRFLLFYFDLLAQVLHLIDFFRLSFSNNYFGHFFCFVLLLEVV
jgi:hypothetical protein